MVSRWADRESERAAYMRAKAARRSAYVKQNQSRRIYALLRTAIRSGTVGQGTHLDEAALMREYVATRTSVRTALVQLADDGLVTRVPGAGTYVGEFFEGIELVKAQARSPAAEKEFTCETLFAGLVPGTPDLCAQLGLEERSSVRAAEYFLKVNGVAYCLETIYWAPDVEPRVPFVATDDHDLPAAFHRHFGVALGRSTITVEAIRGDDATTGMLGLAAGAPILLSEKVLVGADGRARELQYIYYSAAKSYFMTDMSYDALSLVE